MPVNKIVTKNNEQSTAIEWVLTKECLLARAGTECVTTPYLKLPGIENANWSICAYPRGYGKGKKHYLSLFVVCRSEQPINAHVVFKLSGNPRTKCSRRFTFSKKRSYNGFEQFALRSQLFDTHFGYFTDDRIQIHCTMTYVLMDGRSIVLEQDSEAKNLPDVRLWKCFKNPEIAELSDCTLIVSGIEYECHKLILFARSPVFRAMLTNNGFRESESNKIEITGFKPSLIKTVLSFFYNGSVKDKNVKNMTKVQDLLRFADMYDVATLRALLETKLINTICFDNVCDLANIAEKTNSTDLRTACVDFLKNYLKDTPTFSGLWNLDGQVFLDVLKSGNETVV